MYGPDHTSKYGCPERKLFRVNYSQLLLERFDRRDDKTRDTLSEKSE